MINMCSNSNRGYYLYDFNGIILTIDVKDITPQDLPLTCSCTLTGSSQYFLFQNVEVSQPELVECFWSGQSKNCINDFYIPCRYNWGCQRWRVDEDQEYWIYLYNNQHSWSLDIDNLPNSVRTRDVKATIWLQKEGDGK